MKPIIGHSYIEDLTDTVRKNDQFVFVKTDKDRWIEVDFGWIGQSMKEIFGELGENKSFMVRRPIYKKRLG